VGHKLRELRKQRNLTQMELSRRIGVQQSDLSRMEKGEYRVSLDTLFRILAEFRVGLGEFFDDLTRESFTPHDLRLVQEIHRLPPQDQREIETLVAEKSERAANRPQPQSTVA
jgi:transcriptional regulator with XRE-family HTH domain